MFSDFFKGKQILVTGVGGVKGSWLALQLLEAGSQVVGMDIKPPEPNSNFTASGLREKVSFVQGDVTNLTLMRDLMKDVDGVFHLAAVALVGEARRNPLEAYRTNTLGTVTVLEAVRLSDSVKYAVFVTTDKVYKSKDGEVWVEDDPLVASAPYPVSKACAEYAIADYYRSYLQQAGKRIGVGRAGNVIVGGDFNSSRKTNGAGRIFVDCFESLMEQRAPEIYAPKLTRPYTYGLDILAGYMALMSKLDCVGMSGEAFNFGPHEYYGVENSLLATKICELWGTGITWRQGVHRDEPFVKQSLSWEKARRCLDWQPTYTLYEALRETTDWYQKWLTHGKDAGEGGMLAFNQSLIRKHREAAQSLGVSWAKTAKT